MYNRHTSCKCHLFAHIHCLYIYQDHRQNVERTLYRSQPQLQLLETFGIEDSPSRCHLLQQFANSCKIFWRTIVLICQTYECMPDNAYNTRLYQGTSFPFCTLQLCNFSYHQRRGCMPSKSRTFHSEEVFSCFRKHWAHKFHCRCLMLSKSHHKACSHLIQSPFQFPSIH